MKRLKKQAQKLGQDASENRNISNKNFQKKTEKKEGKKTSDLRLWIWTFGLTVIKQSKVNISLQSF